VTPQTPSSASPWRAWGLPRRGERIAPPSRLLIRRALNDSVIFEALLRELDARAAFRSAPCDERRLREYLAAASETERLCEERLWLRLTPEAATRQDRYAEARRAKLPRREALLFAVGRRPGPLPRWDGANVAPASARPTEAPTASQKGAA
jgi:hypothetical protein